jgi:DNA-binding NtrC family response regulator
MAVADASNVVRLQPVRVLLVGADMRFTRVAAALLSFEGYSVQSCERLRELMEWVHRLSTDVVVIDASRSLADAARATVSLRMLPQPVPAVLVVDHGSDSVAAGMPLISKWGRFEELSARVDQAYQWRCGVCA